MEVFNEVHKSLTDLSEIEKKILNGYNFDIEMFHTNNKMKTIDLNKLLIDDEHLTISKQIRFVDFSNHNHNFVELAYVYSGKLCQNINGNELEVKKGEIIILNQNVYHSVKAAEQGDVIINFLIKPKFFEYALKIMDVDNIIGKFLLSTIYLSTHRPEYLYLKVSEVESIQNIIKEIMLENYKPSIVSKMIINLLINLLLAQILKHSDKIENSSEESYDTKLIITIIKYIDENYAKANLNEICGVLKQPNYKISKLVKNKIGMTFMELIGEKRLEKAIEMLKNTNWPIEEISYQIGYETSSRFYKIFKQKYGISPKEFRKNIKANL